MESFEQVAGILQDILRNKIADPLLGQRPNGQAEATESFVAQGNPSFILSHKLVRNVKQVLVGDQERLDELNGRLERRRRELQQERQLTLGDLTHIGSAWIMPHPERSDFSAMVRDEEVERIAMAEAMRYEREQGWLPEDVSQQDRGFDILSRHPASGSVRFVEVKGRASVGTVVLSRNEYKTAERLRQDYWLYVVFDCATSPRLLPVKDPARLRWEPIVRIDHYQIGAQAVLQEAVQEPGGKT